MVHIAYGRIGHWAAALSLDMTEDEMALPDLVWMISMWWRWASAVRYGYKVIETRHWPWIHGPSWVVIHATKQLDGRVVGRVEPFPAIPDVMDSDVVPGTLCCLVHFAGCRRLEETDRERALVYEDGLYAFDIDTVLPLRPVAMEGARRLKRIPRDIVVGALQ